MKISNVKVEQIISTLWKNGFRAVIAGGSVRDFIRGKKAFDFDLLTNASLDELITVFKGKNARIVGKTFKICLVDNIEISPARFNQYHGSSNKTVFPDNDLAMRDFTINSMAYDMEKRELIDLFTGQKDLKNRIIRFTNDPDQRIEEDPLRIIRACRMASLIKGTIEPASLKALKIKSCLVKKRVSRERLRVEILKAMEHETPSIFFKYLKKIDVLKHLFPCLDQCFDLDGGPYHGETVFEHCMLTGDALSFRYPLLRLAGFLHDAGKYEAAVEKEGKLFFAGHEKHTDQTRADLQYLRFSSQEINYILSIIRVHMRPLKDDTTPKAVRRLLRDLNKDKIDYHDFLRMRIADRRANLAKKPYGFSEIKSRLNKILNEVYSEKNRAFSIKDLAVSGRDVMKILKMGQGPEVGSVLEYLFEKVLDNPKLNNKGELKKLILEYR